MKIETTRLELIGVNPSMIQDLFARKSKSEILEFFGYDESAFERMQTMVERGMETFNLSFIYFILREKTSQKSIGECGFHSWNTIHHKADIFYVMHDDSFKRKGLMKEAAAAVIAYGFEEMKLHRIQALIAKENTASFKILHANQFVFEGIKREDYLVHGTYESSECYSLLVTEWKTRTN